MVRPRAFAVLRFMTSSKELAAAWVEHALLDHLVRSQSSPRHLPLSFTSPYGAENARPAMSPSPASSTRGPTPVSPVTS
jgi:hypothetical protein